MKKSLIAGAGAAAFAFAALPFAGVFAEAPSVVDNVTVRIAESCTFQATQGTGADQEVVPPDSENNAITRSFAKDVELGQAVILGDPAQTDGSGAPAGQDDIVIEGVCNTGDASDPTNSGTWAITAQGNGTTATLNGGTGTTAIESTVAKANLTEGTVSGWGMKIAGDNAATNYDDWYVVPGTAGAVVAEGSAAGTSFAFTPSYRVYVGTEQEAGTYDGTVTYTIAYTQP